MEVNVLFVGMRVREFAAANAWYEQFFGRPADLEANQEEVLWQLTDGGWFYIVREDGAGGGLAALGVGDLDRTVAELKERGIAAGSGTREGDAGWKAVVVDPDGNTLALIEVTAEA